MLTELVTGTFISDRVGGNDFGVRDNQQSIQLRSDVLKEVGSYSKRCHKIAEQVLTALSSDARKTAQDFVALIDGL